MSKGFLIFAENKNDINYLEQAYALALSIKASQKTIKSVSVVTNVSSVPEEYQKVFDQVISIPWYDKEGTAFSAEHRWKLYHVTPYEETIVLDADMLMLEDISTWWSYCNNFDLKYCSKIKTYKNELVFQDTTHRKTFIENNLTNPYCALHYFKKSEKAYEFYKVLEFVINNWEWCYSKFAPNEYQSWLSMDLSVAIATELSGMLDVVDNVCPFEFVHMKSALQNWPVVPQRWTNAVRYYINDTGELFVGNIKQFKLFHYIEKDFLSPLLIKHLEELSNEG